VDLGPHVSDPTSSIVTAEEPVPCFAERFNTLCSYKALRIWSEREVIGERNGVTEK
jgi:hypothetical protein